MARILLVVFLCMVFSGAHPLKDDHPNVVLIIADQMRGDALGALNHPDIKTPFLDEMAKQGVLFRNFFVNNPVCVPSRMSMHSGQYPHQHGSISNKESIRFTSLDGTLLGYFKQKGYKLGWFGKDNHSYDRSLLDQTLDANTSRKREAFRAYTPYIPPFWYSNTPWPQKELFPVKTTDDAIEFIKDVEHEDPFFMVLSLFDPHPPYFAPAAYTAHYPPDDLTLPPYINPEELNPRLADQHRAFLYNEMPEATLRATMAHYYAAIEWGIDYQVGRLMKALETEGIADDTIVIFTSDHGDFMGEFGMVRKSMFMYDALLHVPLIWYAPGRIKAGHQTDVIAQGVDLYPTLLDMVEQGSPEHLPGRSLLPFMNGEPERNPDHVVFAGAGYNDLPEGYFASPEPPFYDPPSDNAKPFHSRILSLTTPPRHRTAMVRNAEWKLIMSETHAPELYHMAGGWQEKKNLANVAQHQAVLKELQHSLLSIWAWGD
ncbi:MAG: sulfatase [Rhodothermales bacterium]